MTTPDDADRANPEDLEPPTERRGATRLTINKQFDTFEDFVREYVTNVSGTGAFVRTDTPLAIGTEVNLRFSVVLEGVETIEGVGVVVRIADDPRGMGVAFKELHGYSKRLMEKLILVES
ncbi:MAG TPA: PilZ domain-containing protein [Polyangiaceae bacterium]|nr:PilZ domain-containing protein [Polyangiaceae bacterium]